MNAMGSHPKKKSPNYINKKESNWLLAILITYNMGLSFSLLNLTQPTEVVDFNHDHLLTHRLVGNPQGPGGTESMSRSKRLILSTM